MATSTIPVLNEREELLRVRDQLLAQDTGQTLDMGTFHCGTTGCIAGWIRMNNEELCNQHGIITISGIARLMGHTYFYVFNKDPLNDLFFMWSVPGGYDNPVSPAQAARAIENYLEFNDPKWPEVLSDVPVS